jgi:hypothetical protein
VEIQASSVTVNYQTKKMGLPGKLWVVERRQSGCSVARST